jgi:hypothetical protein
MLLGAHRNKLFGRAPTDLRVDEVRIEQKLFGLIFYRFNHVRMRMSSRAHRVPAVEIEVLFAVTRPNPCALTALDGDAHFLVGGKLKLVFELCDRFKGHF